MSAEATRPSTLRGAATSLPGVLVHAVRLLGAHWPVLVVVSLLGEAGRGAALWAAVSLSAFNSTLGVLVLAFAPLCSVCALIGMFYVLRESMPGVALADAFLLPADAAPGTTVTERRRQRLLQVLASVLVPFLAVYASYGLLKQDTQSFVNSASYAEFFSSLGRLGQGTYDVNRTALVTGGASVVVIAVAFGLRQLLARWKAVRRRPALALAAGYLEVLWLATIARLLLGYQDRVQEWVTTRRATAVASRAYDRVLDVLGPVADPLDATLAWLARVVGSVDSVVVVPLAWLAVGAVVYGHTLAKPSARQRRPRPRLDRLSRRVPAPVRRWSAEPFAGVTTRFRGFTDGLRQMAVAGLGPMLVFALAFLVAGQAETLIYRLLRVVVGPQTSATFVAFSPWTTMLSRGLSTVLLVVLVAAAVDRLLGATARATRATGPGPGSLSGPPPAPGSPVGTRTP